MGPSFLKQSVSLSQASRRHDLSGSLLGRGNAETIGNETVIESASTIKPEDNKSSHLDRDCGATLYEKVITSAGNSNYRWYGLHTVAWGGPLIKPKRIETE